jgi:RNA polymerase sigma-70 factor (ECF subfamily)
VPGAAAEAFTLFVEGPGSRLRLALGAAYGPEVGAEATSEALAYGWEHWDRLQRMANPAGYLYRVGQSKARRFRRKGIRVDTANPGPAEPWIEPELVPALADLSERQRACVVLVHGFGWTLQEVGDSLDINPSTVQRHIDRGLSKLRARLEVASA